MRDKCQGCVSCLLHFSFHSLPLIHCQTLFPAANLFFQMRPPVSLPHCCSSFLCSCYSLCQESFTNHILCLISASVSFGTPFKHLFQQGFPDSQQWKPLPSLGEMLLLWSSITPWASLYHHVSTLITPYRFYRMVVFCPSSVPCLIPLNPSSLALCLTLNRSSINSC